MTDGSNGHKPGPPPRVDWQDKFLEAFRNGGVVVAAARAAGVSRDTVRIERIRNEDFALAYQDAKNDAVEIVEMELLRRATTGTPTKKTVRVLDADGKIVQETITESLYISTAAAIAFLRANHPAYREQWRIEHTGPDGGPVQVAVERDRTPERLEALLEIAAELGWSPQHALPPPSTNGA